MAKKKVVGKIVRLVISAILLVGVIIGSVIAEDYAFVITAFFSGTGEDFSQAGTQLAVSDTLCRKIGDESMVLLKNENGALPLQEDERKINVFGYGALTSVVDSNEGGFVLKGEGSGSSTIGEGKTVSLLEALEQGGFAYNKEVIKVFKDYRTDHFNSLRPYNSYQVSPEKVYNLAEPATSAFSSKLLEEAKEFSDVAMFVISRVGGEGLGELPLTYLDITAAEQAILDMIKVNFEKVIVLINTTNVLHCGFLEDDDISAALYVGGTGQSGATAIPRILKGEVNPSGKTADTYAYTNTYDPAIANITVTNIERDYDSAQYMEDIYFGYKWYETADAMNYFATVDNQYGNGYEGVVQYPFGYGLSYTTFEWEVQNVTGEVNTLSKDTEITVTVRVKNTGDVAGKDIVELYYTPPYFSGEVEKAEVNLLDFEKTDLLEPNESQDITFTFTAYDMASYDCYDKNKNGSATYELDAGDYFIELRTDAHTLKNCDNAKMTYRVESDIIIDKDPVTGTTVSNQFTGEDAYLGTPTDGSTVGCSTNYLTRSDFAGTFPTTKASAPTDKAEITATSEAMYTGYDNVARPKYGQENNLRLAKLDNGTYATKQQLEDKKSWPEGVTLVYDDELLAQLAEDYDSELWEKLLDQMTIAELNDLVVRGGFQRRAIVSIGKPRQADYDGPAGFNLVSTAGTTDRGDWTAFPCESLIACSWNKGLLFEMGRSMGAEGAASSVSGWYAPGVNLHRSPYGGRNFEYYSEDAVLSGELAAQVVYGAKTNGLTCYMKHFAVYEFGTTNSGMNTWLTEQNLRENYLKAFEIAVKEGGANGMMSTFTRVGASWSGANWALLTQVLRNEWGFRGLVITDWTNAAEGVGWMNVSQGVRAGNDLWLNPTEGGRDPGNSTTAVYCLRKSAHNILYELADTRTTMLNSNIDDGMQNNGDIVLGNAVFAWWRIPLYGIVALIGLFFVTSLVFMFKRNKVQGIDVSPEADM